MPITEGTQPAAVTWTGAWTAAQTTASFTPEAGALLVALVSGDGNQVAGAVTANVTDSLSGSWTLLKRQNSTTANVGGTAEVWCRDSPGASMTVSVTGSGNPANGGQLVVRTLIGAKAAASQNGATAGATNDPAATMAVSVAAGTGGKVYGAAFNWAASTAMTPNGISANVANFADTTNGDNWAAYKSSGDTAGTASYGYSTSTTGMIAAAEILAPAAGGGIPAAAPGQTWLRRFHHRQFPPQFPAVSAPPAGVQPLPVIGQAAATPGFGIPLPAAVVRSSLQDFATPVSPAPEIIQAAATPGFGAPGPAAVLRNTLTDPPVLTTPAPEIIPAAATPGFGQPGPPVIGEAPFIAAAAPTQATPPPLVAAQQPPAVPPGPAVISRNSLTDAPVLTTPRPVVQMATAVTPYGQPQAAVISQAPVIPAAAAAVTPQPVVVAQAVKTAAAQPPVILRNTLADPPVLTTPRPLVVMSQVRPPPTTTVILAAPFIPPPPPFQVARSTAMVTAGFTSNSTVTDPRDGTASVTAAAMSTPGVTDPRDGTATVTAPDTSAPTVS